MPPRTQCSSPNTDLYGRLGLHNPDKGGISCVGWAPSQKRRCRNPIAFHNVSNAQSLLAVIDVRASRRCLEQQLHELAGYVLCRGNHQPQIDEVAAKWYQMLVNPDDAESNDDESDSGYASSEDESEDTVKLLLERMRRMEERLRRTEERLAEEQRRAQEQREAEQRRLEAERQRAEERRAAETLREGERRREERRRCAEREQAVREEAEQERAEMEEAERQQAARELVLRNQAAHEQADREAAEAEAQRRAEHEHHEQQRAERERADREAEARRRTEERERAERDEAQRRRHQRERADAAEAERERQTAAQIQAEYDSAWRRYNRDWANLSRLDTSTFDEELKDSVPWPVKSGRWQDVNESNIKQFFKRAPDGVPSSWPRFRSLLRRETLRWHEDKLRQFFPRIARDEECLLKATVVMHVINELCIRGRGSV